MKCTGICRWHNRFQRLEWGHRAAGRGGESHIRGSHVTDSKKTLLVNIALAVVVVLLVVMLVQLIRRDVAVRKDLAATQAAPVGRTFPLITAPVDVLKDLLASLSAGDREAVLNRLVCSDAAAQREADVVFGAPCVWHHFETVARKTFGKQVPPSSPGTSESRIEHQIEGIRKYAW